MCVCPCLQYICTFECPQCAAGRSYTCILSDLQVIEAVINRSSALSALGITITGGVSSPNLYRPMDTGLYILKLTQRGAAYQNGTLQAGDRILAVSATWLFCGIVTLVMGDVVLCTRIII